MLEYSFNYSLSDRFTFAPMFGIGNGNTIDEAYQNLFDKLLENHELEIIQIYKETAELQQTKSFMKKILYQKNTSGKTKVWECQVINHGDHSEILVHTGQQGGSMVPSSTFIKEGKNQGKANGTDHWSQAIAEAESKITKKQKSGYVDDINQIQKQSVLGSGTPKPMLAQKYDPTGKQKGSKTLDQIKINGIVASKTILYAQRKYDGNRCCSKVTRDEVLMYSRNGELLPPLLHITNEILDSFKKIYKYVNEKYGVEEYWLDGELYTTVCSFNKLNGVIKKHESNRTDEDKDLLKQVSYNIYDVMIDVGYETRMKIIKYFESPNVNLVQTFEIDPSNTPDVVKELKKLLEQFLEEGYEGAMLRIPGVPYENKRTYQLCKYKTFEDEEFEIVGGEESVRQGMLGSFIMKLLKPVNINGRIVETFNAKPKGKHEELKEYWNNLNKYIGKQATVEFFERSEYGIPRFPVASKIHE